MKKRLLSLFFLLILVLPACGGANDNTSPTDTDTPEVNNGPTSSVAICTAQSQELGDIAQSGDRITGATEDYAVTLIEYGDFQ